ncbi:MAG: flagellar hook basal-body protein [Fibrobacteria bacterium]|nr:flagellar hook basal-body protein [Fibrobacteria bacterium]
MSIDFSSSINGIRSAIHTNSVRANNVANVNSKGFKSSRSVQSDSAGSGPRVSAVSLDISQGPIRLTQNPTDIALEGKGFFQVETPNGDKRYTRSLKIQQSPDGKLLDQHGNQLSGVTQNREGLKGLEVSQDGSIFFQDPDGTTVKVGQLMVVDFNNPQGLEHENNGYFKPTVASGQAMASSQGMKVIQGAEEMSNVDLAKQMTGQMIDEKTVAANADVIRTQDDMLGEIIDLKG